MRNSTRTAFRAMILVWVTGMIVTLSVPIRGESTLADGFARPALTPKVTEGEVVRIEGPPSDLRDTDREFNSIESVQKTIGPRRAAADGGYAKCRKSWLSVKHPDVDLATIAGLVRKRYQELIAAEVSPPEITGIEVEHLTLVYPPNYGGNRKESIVHARRLKINAVDSHGDKRWITAYYLNYDKVDPGNSRVVFQINGHFGRNPSAQGIGLESRGGYSGAALGILAIGGVPIITFDDHDVGQSSPATGKQNGLIRTLQNLRMVDDALLVHFDRVDGVGLSGGCERLYHFLLLHRCNLKSAYQAGLFTSPWTRMDTAERTGGPFRSDGDTDNETFGANFQWSDLVLVGIAEGIDVAFAHATNEGGTGKNCFFKEMLPTLRRYTEKFAVRGDDTDGDGVSNTGRNLSHEYDMIDLAEFLDVSLAPAG